MRLRTLQVNRAGPARAAGGWLKCPVTLLVPGVLAGSAGALMYPAAEVAKTAHLWEGMPITNGHPTRAGEMVRARDVPSSHLGVVRNPRVDARGKLVGEGWFNVKATQRAAPELLAALRAGERVEVSTGLFTRNEKARGTFNGRAYDAVARDYKPDHLAVLIDQEGACSINDGCGVHVTNARARPECGPYCDCDDCDTLPVSAGPLVEVEGRDGAGADDDDDADGGLPIPVMQYG